MSLFVAAKIKSFLPFPCITVRIRDASSRLVQGADMYVSRLVARLDVKHTYLMFSTQTFSAGDIERVKSIRQVQAS